MKRSFRSLMTAVVAAGALVPLCLATTANATSLSASRATASLGLLVEPGQIAAVDSVLTSPQHTLDMTMYELADPVAEADLAADAARGVTVRVVLDRNREGAANTPAYEYLSAHRVHVHWAPSSYDATHEKAVVIDAGHPDELALAMTLNLTSRYYATTRDFAVVDRAPADVAAIESVFNADFAGNQSASTRSGVDLVWSPGSQQALVRLTGSARHSLAVENEEMASPEIVSALSAAAKAGVVTHVTMTYDSSYSAELSELVSAGVGAHVYPDTSSALYIHAKVIVVDAGTAYEKAFIGSENFSAASMDHNRELGIITTDPTVVNKLASVLGQDYTGAPPFNATTPPEPTTTTAAAGGQVSNTTPSGHYYKPGEYCPHKDLGKTIADPYGTMTCKEPPGGGQPRWVAA